MQNTNIFYNIKYYIKSKLHFFYLQVTTIQTAVKHYCDAVVLALSHIARLVIVLSFHVCVWHVLSCSAFVKITLTTFGCGFYFQSLLPVDRVTSQDEMFEQFFHVVLVVPCGDHFASVDRGSS